MQQRDRETALGLIVGALAAYALAVLIGHGTYAMPSGPVAGAAVERPGVATLDLDRLVQAFAVREGGGRDHKPYLDCRRKHRHRAACYAWGYFAFHVERWVESGGSQKTWGLAGRDEQYRVMGLAVRRYINGPPPSTDVDAAITWAANFHNIGHGSSVESAYTRSVVGHYRAQAPGP